MMNENVSQNTALSPNCQIVNQIQIHQQFPVPPQTIPAKAGISINYR